MTDIAIKTQSATITIEALAKKFSTWFKATFLHPGEKMKTFYALMVVGFLCFIYTWITHYFTVPLGGDYTLQMMTFIYNTYDDWHEFFQTGVFPTWDTSAFIGIDNVAGNSFYYLFDPFMLILLIFPRGWLTTLQGLEIPLKMVLGGMFFYWYLGSFKFSPKTKRIGALCFAYSGFSFCYLWFHFQSVVTFLPLILLGVENVIQKRDPRVLLFGFFLTGMTNYFFFVVFIIGAFLYAIFRFLQTMKQRSFSDNWAALGMGIASFVLGIMLVAFTLLPGISMALNMPRLSSTNSTWWDNVKEASGILEKIKAIFTYPSDHSQNQVTPLFNFLFMTDGCFYSNLLNVYWYDNFAGSLYATTPMLLLFFVSLIYAFREKKYGQIIGFILTLLLIFSPLGFYLFTGLSVGYARYFILPICWMIVFDCQALEKRREIPRTYLDLSFVIVMILDAICCFLLIYEVNLKPNSYTSDTYWDLRMILIILSMAWVAVCYALMRLLFHKKGFSKAIFSLCSIDIIVMANVTILFQGTTDIDYMAGGQNNIATDTEIVSLLEDTEGDNYRIYNTTADRGNINISMREGYNGLGAFHSVYPFGLQDFIDKSKIPYSYHNWSVGIHNHRENLETFLSTKYYLVPKVDTSFLNSPYTLPNRDSYYGYYYDIPYGYTNILDLNDEEKVALGVNYSDDLLNYLASSSCHKSLYVNTNFIDTFFAFDTVIDADWVDSDYEDLNEYPLLRAAMLDDDDYQVFKKAGKYNAGTFTSNGVTHTYNYSTVTSNSTMFLNDLTDTTYVEGNSSPIQQVYGKTNIKTTVYSSKLDENGYYIMWDGDYVAANDASDEEVKAVEAKRTAWQKAHPFETMNGIYPTDYKYDYYTKKDDDGKTSDKYTNSLCWNSKIVLTPIDSSGNATVLCPEADPNDLTTGSYISLKTSLDVEWRLYDSNNCLISVCQPSYSDYKTAHGYYTDRPVAKIVGIFKQGSTSDPNILSQAPQIFIQRDKDYQSAVDSLKKNAPTINSRSNSSIDFTTDYSTKKFVVINYPKQDGWSLYKKTSDSSSKTGYSLKEVTQYKAQGGFIGFEADTGKNEYVLSYESPYFKLGGMITMVGMFISLMFLAFFTSKQHKDHGQDNIITLKFDASKEIIAEQYKYDNYEM